MLNEEERTRLANNIAGHVANTLDMIQQRVVEMFGKCDADYGARIAAKLKELKGMFVFVCVGLSSLRYAWWGV